jgi:tetratricopeptide (TPR) repeat protein
VSGRATGYSRLTTGRAFRRAGLSIALLVIAGGLARADSIVLGDGRRLDNVELIHARHDEVVYKVGRGREQTLGGETVERVERVSNLLAGPRKTLQRGDYKAAAKQFFDLKPTEDWEKAEALYFVGYCLLEAGDAKNAAAAFRKYLTDHRESKDWWVPHAVYGLGMAALELGQPRSAETHFKELPGFGRQWNLRALMGEAHALRIGKKYVESRNLFNKIIGDARLPAALRQEAMVGYAHTQMAQEQYDQVIERLNAWFFDGALASDIAYSEWRARATLLMGRAHLARGTQLGLQEAEVYLLKTAALYGEYPAVYKEACRDLVAVYEKLGRSAQASAWKERETEAS